MTGKTKFFIETFGCQMNVNDSEKIAGLLAASGHTAVPSKEEADFIFVNTCAVREHASEKLFHALGRLRKLKQTRPNLLVGVGGCVAQLQGQAIVKRAPVVDLLVGTHTFSRVPELLERVRSGAESVVDLDRAHDPFAVPDNSVLHSSAIRAFVTVMEGCNHVCSFCVVPKTRGPEVCRDPDAIVAEVRSLVGRGFAEVMLLGQTVNAYSHGDLDFAGLLQRVDQVPGLLRLRFTTSHPSHVGESLIGALRDLKTLCPYLHLPVQSGSDRILREMRRGYSRDEYLRIIDRLRAAVPNLALSTDLIVGYAGETEEDFEATVRLVDAVGFDSVFVFAYSPRPGTTAYRGGDPVPADEKDRRLQVLNGQQQRRQALHHQALVGKEVHVLVDVASKGRLSGRTRDNRIVHVEGPEELLGREVPVIVASAGPNALIGRSIGASDPPDPVAEQRVGGAC
jgi:tRNA-2-methylthio-N6-dimethylallyladenosine synthase